MCQYSGKVSYYNFKQQTIIICIKEFINVETFLLYDYCLFYLIHIQEDVIICMQNVVKKVKHKKQQRNWAIFIFQALELAQVFQWAVS